MAEPFSYRGREITEESSPQLLREVTQHIMEDYVRDIPVMGLAVMIGDLITFKNTPIDSLVMLAKVKTFTLVITAVLRARQLEVLQYLNSCSVEDQASILSLLGWSKENEG